ncbi:sugar-binding domain-containing protein [Granulicella aggregans]|uniref:sugar-binding domain-containing protein n=1 Tax=Granulicella aggregans TaxID=474949 RepID=UPI0021E0CA51|nr:sugar-binding domain-containing protein [Granulicella aggregans]
MTTHIIMRDAGLEFYRNMVKQDKRVIVVAGTYKANAVLAALKGKLFNVWVTDDRTAKQVLDAG